MIEALRDNPPDVAAWRMGFAVSSVGEDGQPAPVSAVGDHAVVGDRLRFTPRFPAVRGLTYEVRVAMSSLLAPTKHLHSGGSAESAPGAPGTGVGGAVVISRVTVPETGRPPTVVEVVHPALDLIPANVLRIYLHFSAAMARGEAYRHLRLEQHDGTAVEAAFLELPEELWDGERRRFTLLFDPGRIKRGLSPHEALGPPLHPGKRYRLIIDGGWRDAEGRPLGQDHIYRFETGAADRRMPRIDEWTVDAPDAGTRRSLNVNFGEPLDHALAARLISLLDAEGQRVEGTVSVDAGGHRWQLVPARDWRAGEYRLVADGALEDLAGNSLRGVFDRDLAAGERESESRRFDRVVEIRP